MSSTLFYETLFNLLLIQSMLLKPSSFKKKCSLPPARKQLHIPIPKAECKAADFRISVTQGV